MVLYRTHVNLIKMRGDGTIYIERDGIIIRDIQPGDTEAFIKMASDGSLTEIFGNCADCSTWMGGWADEAAYLAKKDNPLNGYLAYSIVCKSNNQVAGSVGCSYYEDKKETGITYFTGGIYRGKGYASLAAGIYSSYFLEHYPDIPYLIATVRVDNIPSCKVAENAGFLLEETKLYQDIYDNEPCKYNFYIKKRNTGKT